MGKKSEIERIVMRRVHTIHALRRVFSGATLAGLVLIIALWAIGQEVWIARVFENAQSAHGFVAVMRFYLAAFENTHVSVQALSIATLASCIYLARASARSLADLVSTSLAHARV